MMLCIEFIIKHGTGDIGFHVMRFVAVDAALWVESGCDSTAAELSTPLASNQ